MRITLPFEDLKIKAGEAIMVHEPGGKEHYIKKVSHEHRGSKIVTIIETVPYDEFRGKHRSEL